MHQRPLSVMISMAGVLVLQAVVQLVYEKEHRLRSMMRMHGLTNGVYLFVMYLYFIIQYILYVAIMIAAGVIAGLGFFRLNDYGALDSHRESLSVTLRYFLNHPRQVAVLHSGPHHPNQAGSEFNGESRCE
jgi:hypothetical protein